jgi:hypothetical protein
LCGFFSEKQVYKLLSLLHFSADFHSTDVKQPPIRQVVSEANGRMEFARKLL